MNKKRDDASEDLFENDDQRGDRPKQATSPTEDEPEEGDAHPETEIYVTLVDEAIEPERSGQPVNAPVSPGTDLRQLSAVDVSISTAPEVQLRSHAEDVSTVVRPQHQLEEQSREEHDQPVIIGPPLDHIQAERTKSSPVQSVQPKEQLGSERDIALSPSQDIEPESVTDEVTQIIEPSQTASQVQQQRGGFLEIDERDPVFQWSGGSPYGSDRPKFVVHVDNGEVPSLPFLQILLRDTYKEVRGGEPGADTVEFVANEPRIPTIQNNIVTLDLTQGDWQPALRNDEPAIEGNGIDLVAKLRDVAGELYTGELGHFVLNLPGEWEHPYRRKEYNRKLVETLARQDVSEKESEAGTLIEKVRASPVILADPSISDVERFFERVAQYFSLTPMTKASSVGQIEEVKERVLQKHDWRRVVLTEQQGTGEGESSEHYFWKAAIVEGVARTIWQENERGMAEFEDFMKQYLLSNENDVVVETERDLEDDVIPDIWIDADTEWAVEGLNQFLSPADEERTVRTPVAIEFETGRSEGAFNFRKIRDTLEKYEEVGDTPGQICIVVPTRLLFKGRKRAEMILHLVEPWDESSPDAEIFTPVLSGGTCTKLVPARELVNVFYGEQNNDE